MQAARHNAAVQRLKIAYEHIGEEGKARTGKSQPEAPPGGPLQPTRNHQVQQQTRESVSSVALGGQMTTAALPFGPSSATDSPAGPPQTAWLSNARPADA